MTFDEYLEVSYHRYMDNDERYGQALMNALQQVKPDLYTIVTDSLIDPYYTDHTTPGGWDRVNLFLDWVKSQWETETI